MDNDEYEEVLERFEAGSNSDEDDYEDRKHYLHPTSIFDDEEPTVYHEKAQEMWFGLSKDEKYEFLVAFREVAGANKETLPGHKVYDLMLAMGFTLESTDISKLLKNCIRDKNGEYTVSSLEAAVQKWVSNILQLDHLRAIFLMLVNEKCLTEEFPVDYLHEDVPDDAVIEKETLGIYLNKILRTISDRDRIPEDEVTRDLFT